MSPATSTVSVIVLSYNRPAQLRDALNSLTKQRYSNFDVTVVDNPSGASGEVANVLSQFPGVRLIRNSENTGYAGGMNRGIAEATGRYVYLTEDDIVLDKDCLAILVDYAQQQAEPAGLIAPMIYNRGSETIRCAGGELSLGRIFGNKIHGAGEPDTGQYPEPFEVTFLAGSAIFCELEFLRRIGGFREEFFMYSEDRELCARVSKTGRRIMVVPTARVYHFEPASEAVSDDLKFHMLKNLCSLYLLHAPLRVLPEFVCRYILLNPIRRSITARESAAPVLRAWWWVAKNSGALLGERRRSSSQKLTLPNGTRVSTET